ncbi:MAG: hypothetical protein WC903_08890, partial [Candidatus Margulisiibacteriota bacterium]
GGTGGAGRPSLPPFIEKVCLETAKERMTELLDLVQESLEPKGFEFAQASLRPDCIMMRTFLEDAHKLFKQFNHPDLFPIGLRLIDYSYRLNPMDNVTDVLSKLSEYIELTQNTVERNEKRKELAALLANIGNFEAAIKTAQSITGPDIRFDTFFNSIVPVLIACREVPLAIECLSTHCRGQINADDDLRIKSKKIERALLVAGKLIELGENQKAEDILFPAVGPLKNDREEDRSCLEKAAILLSRLGKKKAAIKLLIEGRFDARLIKPDQFEEEKLNLLARQWPDFYAELMKHSDQ